MYKQLPHQVTRIDTGLISDGIVACYLLESMGEVAIIETGNYKTTQRILKLLEQKQIAREKVRYIIPTHVHLDHAGGSSSLIENLPDAMLVIHPRGARHMIDPSKLIAGSTAVYGEKKFKEYYGEITPVPEEKIIIAEDNQVLTLGTRKLLFRETPGHATHHFCVWDEQSSGWFTGDTFGIGYPTLSQGDSPFLFPSSTPVQFDPSALKNSIEMMMRYQPKCMYLTHFGMISVDRNISDRLCEQIDDYVDIVKSLPEKDITVENIKSRMEDYSYEKLTELGSSVSKQELLNIMAHDIALNSMGLKVWHDRYVASSDSC